jgi:NADH-quinone oxidoreductase subunit N
MKELLITALLGIGILAFDILNLRKLVLPLILISLAALVGCIAYDWNSTETPFNQMMLIYDRGSLATIGIFSTVLFFWFVLSSGYFNQHSGKTDLYALIAFSFCGAAIMAAFGNLAMLFLGVEILSIPVYVLAASNKTNLKSNESGFKYFIMGSVASAILLFGIAFIYGATGTFDLATIASFYQDTATPLLFNLGATLLLVGFLFKISAAPFHIWTPDVYEGAPTWITAYMSTVVKGAAVIALFKLFIGPFSEFTQSHQSTLVILVIGTLILSNTAALLQKNIKRMLAYSSISHAGFLLAMLIGNASLPTVLFYILTYSLSSLVAFGVLKEVEITGEDEIKGLYRRNPTLAIAFTAALLSMAGIPPLGGFIAKYFVISQVLGVNQILLVVVMILTSAVGAYYYLRSSLNVFEQIPNAGRIVVSGAVKFTYLVLTLCLVAVSVLAGFLHLV